MATASQSTQETGTAFLTSLCHQIDFSSSSSKVLWHRHHHEMIAAILHRRCRNGYVRVTAALCISNSKRTAIAQQVAIRRRMSNQTNHSPGDKLDVPGAKVRRRAVRHQLGADRGELRTRAITPSQKKLFFTSILWTVALRTDELEGDGRNRGPAQRNRSKGV
jgi:hypothetical protein